MGRKMGRPHLQRRRKWVAGLTKSQRAGPGIGEVKTRTSESGRRTCVLCQPVCPPLALPRPFRCLTPRHICDWLSSERLTMTEMKGMDDDDDDDDDDGGDDGASLAFAPLSYAAGLCQRVGEEGEGRGVLATTACWAAWRNAGVWEAFGGGLTFRVLRRFRSQQASRPSPTSSRLRGKTSPCRSPKPHGIVLCVTSKPRTLVSVSL